MYSKIILSQLVDDWSCTTCTVQIRFNSCVHNANYKQMYINHSVTYVLVHICKFIYIYTCLQLYRGEFSEQIQAIRVQYMAQTAMEEEWKE